MKKNAVISALLCLSLLSGCAAGTVYSVPVPSPSETATVCATEATPEPVELEQVSADGLVLRLLEEELAQSPQGNVILSPLSIEMALAMAANGASGEAGQALKNLLGTGAATLNAALGAYLQKKDDTLYLANSMWFNEKLEGMVKEEFKKTLAAVYGAGEGGFAPGSAADAARINGWVKENTHDKIDSIINASDLKEDTLALLINALYFDGKWASPFEERDVWDEKFQTPNGPEDAKLMYCEEKTYFEHDGFTGFAKPYKNDYEFIGILPESQELDLSGLDIDAFLESRTGVYDVDVKLPKFELEYSNSLKKTLCALGLESLFRDHALDAMLTEEALAGDWTAGVSDVLHKTYMKMYEEGTEAAAVTAVVIYKATSAMNPHVRERKQVYLDRPFAFLIRDTRSGQVVFCGAVNSVK